MNSIFDSIFGSAGTVSPLEFVICIAAALLIGFATSGIYMYRSHHSDSLALTIAVLPAVVCVVIMAVSGDIGAGIAMAGAFSLVRFRSAPGSAKEIVVIFLSMAAGLLIGMGYIAYAAVFSAVMGLVLLACTSLRFGKAFSSDEERVIKVTVPEDLDYSSEIDPVISEYSERYELTSVRSANMGSMFRLTYKAVLKDVSRHRELIDSIRVRNGNLEVAVLRGETEERGLRSYGLQSRVQEIRAEVPHGRGPDGRRPRRAEGEYGPGQVRPQLCQERLPRHRGLPPGSPLHREAGLQGEAEAQELRESRRERYDLRRAEEEIRLCRLQKAPVHAFG